MWSRKFFRPRRSLIWETAEQNLSWIWTKKVHLKLKKKLSGIVGGRSKQVCNVLTDLPKPLRTQIWWYMSPMGNTSNSEVGLSAAFSTKWRFSMHLEIWSKMQQISPTSLPPALLMVAIYHLISVLRGFDKSAETLRTCPGCLTTIYHNFVLQLLRRIFEKIRDMYYVVTSKFCSKCKGFTLIMHKSHFL